MGASGTVTGSKFLVDTGDFKIMLDCGLFQGLKNLRLLNWDYPQVDVETIDTVLLTHGHLDHTGFLPRLVDLGFNGRILGTDPTLDIAAIILRDSGKIQEEEAKRANREGYSKHKPAKPLYDVEQAEKAISRFSTVPEGEWQELHPGIRARFRYNGHILGACFIEVYIRGRMLVFSGDVGRKEDLLMRAPERPENADVLFIESTYGNRVHPKENVKEKLQEIIGHTFGKGGTLIIPSFAVERTQTLMYLLWQLRKENRIPEVPVIMDSPMGTNVLHVFHRHEEWHKLPLDDCTQMCRDIEVVQSFKETQKIISNPNPKIVIAGSGMVTGGRVLSYLQTYLGKPDTSILLAGYQAEGTGGRALLEGAKLLKIYGRKYPVKAEIFNLHALSAHADKEELLDWMGALQQPPEKILVVHGEAAAAASFSQAISEKFGWPSHIPDLYSIVEL